MKRGSTRTTSKPQKRSRRRTSHDRTLLIGLLVVIAVLLGVLIALLPDTVPEPEDSEMTAVGDGNGTPPPNEADDSPGAPATDDEDARTTGARESTGDATQGEGGITESYPEEEPAPVRPEGEEPGDLWWLPSDVVPPEERGPLVLVLDDAGNSLDGFESFLSLPVPLSVAILPLLDYSVQAAAMTAAAEKEILLHQPMEALGGANPGPGAIGPDLSRREIADRLAENLTSVPGVIGVNNHMGSLATAESDVMHAVFEVLRERGLFFLDSRTSAQTVGRTVAAQVGIPFAERNVFLDNTRTREAILGSIGHGLELAQTGEPVIMIGHATVPLLAEILLEIHPIIAREGYRFEWLSTLARPVQFAAGDVE